MTPLRMGRGELGTVGIVAKGRQEGVCYQDFVGIAQVGVKGCPLLGKSLL